MTELLELSVDPGHGSPREHPALGSLALVDGAGAERSLAGRSAVVHFMRSATCPACLAHAAAVQRMHDAGLRKVGLLQHSGTFVLDAEGTIRAARTAAMPTASFSAAEVRSAIVEIADRSTPQRP